MQVRGDVLRVRSAELTLKTCQRYFSYRHAYTARDGSEEVSERYAELEDIYVLLIEDKELILLKARFFQDQAASVDIATQTVRLRLDLAFDTTTEDIVQAKDITNQVVVVPLPYEQHRALILDRYFDTLLIPGDV